MVSWFYIQWNTSPEEMKDNLKLFRNLEKATNIWLILHILSRREKLLKEKDLLYLIIDLDVSMLLFQIEQLLGKNLFL